MDQVTIDKGRDRLQDQLADYAFTLRFEDLAAEDLHAARVRIMDTVGALFGGFPGEPCKIARRTAARMPCPEGAAIWGTKDRTTTDMAAFVNGTTARYVEMNDVYHWPGSSGGHPSDVVMPVMAAAEEVGAQGRDLVTAVALAYEVYLRVADATKIPGFDSTNFLCLATALAAGKLFGLSREQLGHAISMAIVPNNALRRGRTGHLSMWKAVAAGQAGKAGVFAAMIARDGMEGPHLPFEGAHGWFEEVAPKPFSLAPLGGNGTPFKLRDTLIKQRASCATTISSILAAEKAAADLPKDAEIEHVTVETYERAKRGMGTGAHHWNPTNRETADHSIPYVTAAALTDGSVGPKQFEAEKLWDPKLRALLAKIEVVGLPEFSVAYNRHPVEHPTRVIVQLRDGKTVVGESGGDKGDLSNPKSDREIEAKFRSLTEGYFGAERVTKLIDRFWRIDEVADVRELPAAMVIG